MGFDGSSIQGFALTGLGLVNRGFLFAAALLLIKPGWITDLIGLIIGIVIAVFHLAKYRKERELDRSAEAVVPGGR